MRKMGALIVLCTLFTPLIASAFPFGGQANQVVPYYNQAIYANLGAPRGGPYIWTPSTKTYEYGPPAYAGQWILGLASAPYYCLVSVAPIIVWAGTAISMMGSSGPSAGGIYTTNGQAGFGAQPNTGAIQTLINSGASQNASSTAPTQKI